MKKNLSILITSLAGGGAERVVSILLNELKEEYNITLMLMNDTIEYYIPKDTKIIYLENSSVNESNIKKILKLPLLAWKYKKICKQNCIDISLSFMYRPNFINIIAKLFGLKSKIVISERNTPSKVYTGNSFSSITGNYLIEILYKKSDKIIANSKGNSLDLIINYGIDDTKLTVIENPFDLETIVNKSRENIHLDKIKSFVFIMVGRLEEHKRHALAIKAFSKLENKNCELWILGQGPLEEELKNLIQKLQLEDRVKLLGFDNNPYKYMSKADCFILSSTREGFPNVLVEALSCGLPVISTDCYSGPREILSPESDVSYKLKNEIEKAAFGLLVAVDELELLYNAMVQMVKDKKMYNNYKLQVHNRVQDFNKQSIIEKYKKVLKID